MPEKDDDKEVWVFAGPNGSGKTTTRDSFLKDFKGVYINADDIAASLKDQYPDYEQRNLLAANMAEEKRKQCLATGQSFAFETVMSTAEKVALMSEARERGFKIALVFVTTRSADINVSRVHDRVAKNGHPVEESKIRSRYDSAMSLLPSALDQADKAFVFDNSAMSAARPTPALVATKDGLHAKVEFHRKDIPWAGDLQNTIADRVDSLAKLAKSLKERDEQAWVEWATASNGRRYEGNIIAMTSSHALQAIKQEKLQKPTHLVHDFSLTQQKPKDLSVGQNCIVSYSFKHGKVQELQPAPKILRPIDRERE
jgi:predicted ABC-type ATPase